MKKSQEKAEVAKAKENEEPTIQTKLRDELRREVDRQRERADRLEDDIDKLTGERDSLVDKLAEWKDFSYELRDKKSAIEYELLKVRRELEELKQQVALLQHAKEQVDEITDPGD